MPIKDPEKKRASQKRRDVRRAEARSGTRTRNFATVVYPESAPEGWMDKLDELHVSVLISPLHDRDVDPNGEPKKPHYHVLVMFESLKTFETQVKPIFDAIGAVGREDVQSSRGYARYLCHLDNPEKAQYSPSDVRQMGGADFQLITQLPTDDIKLLADIRHWIRENEIYSFAEFLDVAEIHHPEWCALVELSRAYIVGKYIKSLEWERNTGYVRAENRLGCGITGNPHGAENRGDLGCGIMACPHEAPTQKCCPKCGSIDLESKGKTAAGTQRWLCKDCGKSFV